MTSSTDRIMFRSTVFALSTLSLTCLAQETPDSWYEDGRNVVERNLAYRNLASSNAIAKNVILFVGDGMGVSTVTAARILAGQLEGNPGEENELFFETFPNVALSKTYNTGKSNRDCFNFSIVMGSSWYS